MSGPGLFIVGVLVTLIVAGALALLVYAAVLDGRDAATRKAEAETGVASASSQNLLEAARAAGDFKTLVTAIDRAGLSELLTRAGPYTVFAPTDAAFDRLPEGTVDSLLAAPDMLADIVSYHVVPGRVSAAEVGRRASAETLQGEELAISNNGSIRVDGAHLVHGDLDASNGLIHVVDRVLLPARI